MACNLRSALVVLVLTSYVTSQCLSETGASVDWFVMLKPPNSYGFLYADALSQQLVDATGDLTNLNNPISRTLHNMYTGNTLNYIMHSEQAPKDATSSELNSRVQPKRGHSKGVIIWNTNTITWFIHSVPQFPPPKNKGYSYPESGRTNGQSFLCFTLKIDDLPTVANQLFYTWPVIYDYNVDKLFTDKLPRLQLVLNGKHVQQAPWYLIQDFTTVGGTAFKSFAKYGFFNDDLYAGLVSPSLGASFYTETWQKGSGGKLPSNCTIKDNKYFVKNIVTMSLLGHQYTETQDHSKWILADDSGLPVFCVGGINRMRSQYLSGGGTFCFQPRTLWQQIKAGIVAVEECPNAMAESAGCRLDVYSMLLILTAILQCLQHW